MKYKVRINCPCFQDIEVEAENEEEALKLLGEKEQEEVAREFLYFEVTQPVVEKL
ncbi:hypothetical protein KAH94_05885 [bacterium]|nr:hypothetical protein [bacterium]